MLRRVVIQLAGLLLSCGPMGLLLFRLLTQGWRKVFPSRPEQRPPPDVLNDYGQHGFLDVKDGVKIHYVQSGDPEKPLMLFLHGFPEFWFSWRHQMSHFASAFWCVAIDMRGYNDSDKPSGIEHYNMENLVDDVKRVIQGLGRSQCVLVAHDWGGAVGYAFAARWPNMVKQYITCNIPHPKAVRDVQAGSWKQRFMSWYMVFFQCPYLPELFFASNDLHIFDEISCEMKNCDPKIVEAYKYAFRHRATVSATINYYRCALQYPQYGQSFLAKPVEVPVLSIFGTADKYLSVEAAERSRQYVRNFRQEFVSGASHWIQMECPAKVNGIMEDFLRGGGQS